MWAGHTRSLLFIHKSLGSLWSSPVTSALFCKPLVAVSWFHATQFTVALQVRAHKQITIDEPPNVLTVHLKRFEFGQYGSKINKKVEYDLTLDLKPYMHEAHGIPHVGGCLRESTPRCNICKLCVAGWLSNS